MAQEKQVSSDLAELADMRETVKLAQEQLSQNLANIVRHLQRLSRSEILAQDRSNIEKAINKIVSDEFKIISTFLSSMVFSSIEATVEENERLSSTILRLRPELLETETERDHFAQKAYDLEQENKLLREKLKQLAESMENLLSTIQALKTIEKEHEATRLRLKMVLKTADDEPVPQQVERLIGLVLKAGSKIQQAKRKRSNLEKTRSKLEEESFRLRKTYEAVSMLSEHDSTSRMIIILAELGEIEIDQLAEITGQKKILLRYQLKKWANRGLVKLSEDGRVVSLVIKDTNGSDSIYHF